MDLLSLVRKVLRHRFLTIPVIVLTLFAAAYVVAVKQPVYEAKSSFVLLNPPAPPTAEEVARDPALGRLKTDNPYTRFGDQSVIIEVLASTMNGDAARHALDNAGGEYTVAPSADFGYASPIVSIMAAATTPEIAVRTAKRVGEAAKQELDRMQAVEDVDDDYRIKALEVDAPDKAELQASGKLRVLVGVLVLGAVVLFIVVSVTDALDNLRQERRAALLWAAEPWEFGPDPELDPPADENVSNNGRHIEDAPPVEGQRDESAGRPTRG